MWLCVCAQKSAAFALLSVGFSVTAWLLQYLWQNVEDLLLGYSYYVAVYFITAGIVGFAVCYYRGPVTDPRVLDLIRWSIQLLAVVLIYYSSQIAEVSATIIALVVLVSVIPRRFYMLGVPAFIMTYWYVWNCTTVIHHLTQLAYFYIIWLHCYKCQWQAVSQHLILSLWHALLERRHVHNLVPVFSRGCLLTHRGRTDIQ